MKTRQVIMITVPSQLDNRNSKLVEMFGDPNAALAGPTVNGPGNSTFIAAAAYLTDEQWEVVKDWRGPLGSDVDVLATWDGAAWRQVKTFHEFLAENGLTLATTEI